LPISSSLRVSIYGVFGLLWLSGVLWLAVHYLFAQATEFGVVQHPWEHTLLLVHGILAVAAMYALGWIAARHSAPAWGLRERRKSGGFFWTALIVLAITGFGLFFLTDEGWQRSTSFLHEALGALITLSALEHWFISRHRETG